MIKKNKRKNTIRKRSGRKSRKTRNMVNLGLYLVNKLVVAILVFCCVSFVLGINDLSVKGFVLRDLKANLEELKHSNRMYEISIMDLESFESVKKRAEEMNMVKVGEINYVLLKGDVVAKK